MGRQKIENSAPCPYCGGRSVRKNGSSRGHVRLQCFTCKKSFGPTWGTALYRVRTPVKEIAQALLVVMRKGSLRAAEEITGHKAETIREWLLRAGSQAEALTEVLAKELDLEEVEVDAFWSYVGNAAHALQIGHLRHGRGESLGRRVRAGDV
jgi:transposase-like protein